MNHVIYVGRFFPEKCLKTINKDSKGKVGFSNHNFEMSIINGLCQCDDVSLHCITIPGVYSYPHNNRKIYTKSEKYAYKSTIIDSVGFCNVVFVKEIWSTISFVICLLKTIWKIDNDRVDIIVNTPSNRLLNGVWLAKLFTRKRLTQTVIIPDIPAMITSMDKQNILKNILLKWFNASSMKKTAKSEGLVLLSESMLDFVDNKTIKHIVMEGLVDFQSMDVKDSYDVPEHRVILYTGTLRKIFGVLNLVEAFMQIPHKDIELWVCGSGDASDRISEAAESDTRIKFWGLVGSQKALEFQKQATILVNPRTSDGEYTKYSFPSKTMEYLLAGKSVIINKLPGIPEEYYQFVYTPEDESVRALRDCIIRVLDTDKDKLQSKALAGRDFIINNKNSKTQMERVIKMIRSY